MYGCRGPTAWRWTICAICSATGVLLVSVELSEICSKDEDAGQRRIHAHRPRICAGEKGVARAALRIDSRCCESRDLGDDRAGQRVDVALYGAASVPSRASMERLTEPPVSVRFAPPEAVRTCASAAHRVEGLQACPTRVLPVTSDWTADGDIHRTTRAGAGGEARERRKIFQVLFAGVT